MKKVLCLLILISSLSILAGRLPYGSYTNGSLPPIGPADPTGGTCYKNRYICGNFNVAYNASAQTRSNMGSSVYNSCGRPYDTFRLQKYGNYTDTSTNVYMDMIRVWAAEKVTCGGSGYNVAQVNDLKDTLNGLNASMVSEYIFFDFVEGGFGVGVVGISDEAAFWIELNEDGEILDVTEFTEEDDAAFREIDADGIAFTDVPVE